jgi:hypothetical protein
MERPIFQQHFSKGPRVHYSVSLVARDDGSFEVAYRWENPKSSDSRTFSYRSHERAMAIVTEKVVELAARGYERRPPVVRQPTAATATAGASDVAHVLQELVPDRVPAGEGDSLEALLARRRRDASWAIE